MLMALVVLLFVLIGLLLFSYSWFEVMAVLAVLSLVILGKLNYEFCGVQVVGMSWGWDIVSVSLILLSIFIVMLMFGTNVVVYETEGGRVYSIILTVLLINLLLVFISADMLMFYVMFESVLIPSYLLIMGWGYQPERLNASNYLLFYTLFMSLPLLLFMLYLGDYGGSYLFLYNFVDWRVSSLLLWVSGTVAFLVSVPMYILHLWLPSAHVEAPISGSMILAGILLKMGGYGLIRVMLFWGESSWYFSFIIGISFIGGVISGLICLRQSDMKSLVAYSSVVHMSLMLVGIFVMTSVSVGGALVVMVGHGLCSSGLFYLVNLIYERSLSRSIFISRGYMAVYPSLMLLMFMMISSNMSCPPSLNLLGEIYLLGGIIGWDRASVVFIFMIFMLSGAYGVYLYSVIGQGSMSSMIVSGMEVSVNEYFIGMLHWVPLNLLFLKSSLFVL